MKKLIIIIVGVILLAEANPVQPATLEVRAPGGIGTLGDVYTNIQQAIDDASPGDTINVAAGVYDGNTVGPEGHLIIDKANLTLKSAAGKVSTTIKVANGVGIDIRGGAANFVLGGASGQGFTIAGKSDTTFVIQLANAPSGVAISHNTISTTGNASMGVSVGAAGAADLTISNNDFMAEDGDGSIWGPDVYNVTVSYNTFTGPATPTSGYAIQFAGVTSASPSTINGNTIENYGSGVFIHTAGATTIVSALTINNNSISGCLKGIRLGHSSQTLDMDDVTVTGNTLSNNTVGLYIDNSASIKAGQFTVQDNCISGNTYGLQNQHTSEVVNAALNAWGDASGPYHSVKNTSGLGDDVEGDVEIYPWYPDCNFVTPISKRVHNITIDAYYDDIQPAVDEANPGDIIEAGTGVYDEEVTIDKDNLVLKSSSTPVIKPSTTPTNSFQAAVYITADGVTVDGFEIDGTTVCDNCILGWETSGLTIKNNVIHGAVRAWDGCGILLFSWGNGGTVYGNLIQNNEVYDTGRMGIMVMDYGSTYSVTSDNTITGNIVYDTWQVGWGDHGGSIQINVAKNCEITDNVIHHSNDRGIYMFGSASGNKIVGNTITNNPIGVQLWISGEDGESIDWQGETPTSPEVSCNKIYDNNTGAISTNIAGPNMVMDAELNWWGDTSGPGGEGAGSGDAVSTNVDFFPWLLSEDCNDFTLHVVDFVVDDDWQGLPDWTTVTVDGVDYYIGLNAFAVIQGAVDAAGDGNSISVADGNYVGAVLDKDVTLIGANPAESVITTGVPYKAGGGPLTGFRLDAGADGAEIRNFVLDCNRDDSFFFAVFSRNVNDVVIDSLTVNQPVQGISNWGGNNWQITNNQLNETEAAGGGGIAILVGANAGYPTAQGNVIKNNVMTPAATAPDFTCPAVCLCLDLRYGGYESMTGNEDVSYNQISENEITGTGLGSEVGVEVGVIGVSDDPNKIAATLGMVHDNLITANIIDNTDLGVYLYTVTDMAVLGNEIVDCNDAIHIEDSHNNLHVNYNAIIASKTYGLNNAGGSEVDAEYNWWGDVTGPNDPCGTSETDGATCYDTEDIKNADGLGDAVTDNADYCPWLVAPISTSAYSYMPGDLDYDGDVDWRDFAIFAENWLEGTTP